MARYLLTEFSTIKGLSRQGQLNISHGQYPIPAAQRHNIAQKS
jgi:hypothetical protein